MRAARGGVPRVHIIDGRVEEGLLAEVFSNEGIGTLIHANEYQAIRKAHRKDARAILALIKRGVDNDELLRRTRAEIERQHRRLFRLRGGPQPRWPARRCISTRSGSKAELACVCVDAALREPGHRRQADAVRRGAGPGAWASELFCLSTQAFNYFQQKGGFSPGTPDDLPPPRRERYEQERPAVAGAGQEAGVREQRVPCATKY